MKTFPSILRLLGVVFSVLVCCNCLASADSAEPEAVKIPPQRFEAKVLKVFAAKDGAAIFRAYVVKWKDQEVIASDSLAKSNYKEGDTISVLAMNHPFPKGQEPHRLLAFTVVPPPR